MTNPQSRAEKSLHGLVSKEPDSDDSDQEQEVSLFRNDDSELGVAGLHPEQQLWPEQPETAAVLAEEPESQQQVLDLECKLESLQQHEATTFRPQPDTPIPTSNLSLNQSVERNDESQPQDAYHYDEMAPRDIISSDKAELRTEVTPSISDNLLFAVEAGGAKAKIRKLNDPHFSIEVAYPEGDKVQDILKVVITERISQDLDARLLFSVYLVREKTQHKLYLRIHVLKADVAVISLYGGSFVLSTDPQSFKLRNLWLVCNKRICCWTNDSSEFRLLAFREDKLRLVVEADKKETCWTQKTVTLDRAMQVLDLDLLPSKKPCMLVSTKREVWLAEENGSSCIYRCMSDDSAVVAARFVASEQASPNKSHFLVVELRCCKLFAMSSTGGSTELQLLQELSMPREMPDKTVSMTGEEVLVSNRFIVIQRRNDFRAWILLFADSGEEPAVDRQTTISLKGNFKHHTFYCAAVESMAPEDLVYFHSRDRDWALVHLTGCSRLKVFSKIDRQTEDREPVLEDESSAHLESFTQDSDRHRESETLDETVPEVLEQTHDFSKQELPTEELVQPETDPNDGALDQEDPAANWLNQNQKSAPAPQPREQSDSLLKNPSDLASLAMFMAGPSPQETGRSHLNDDGIIIPGAQQSSGDQLDGNEGDDMMNTIMSLSKHTSMQHKDPLDLAQQTRAEDRPEPPSSREKDPLPTTSPPRDLPEARQPEARPFKVKYHHEHQPDPVEPLPEYGSAGRSQLAQETYSATDRTFTGSVPQTPSDLTSSKKLDARATNPKTTNKKPDKTEPVRKQDKTRKHEQVNGSRGYTNQDRDSRGKFGRDDKGDEFVPKKTQAKTVEIKKEEPSQSHHASYSPVPANPANEFEPKQKQANKSSGGSPKNSQSSAPAQVFDQQQKPADQRLFLDEVNSAVRSSVGSLKEDLAHFINARHSETLAMMKAIEASDARREDRIEEIVRRVVSKYVEEKMIQDLKSEFNCLMSNNYNEVFEDVIVPCFENYLGKVCDKTNSVLEKGIKFYNERIMVEERKVTLIKDQFGQITSQLASNSKALNKATQDVATVVKDITSNQNKDLSKRVASLEESVEKIAEKQDRIFDLLEKIGSKLKINEEDKKIDIPTSNSTLPVYSAPPPSNAHLLQEVLDHLKHPAMHLSAPHGHYSAYQRPTLPHPAHGYQSHGPAPGVYGGLQPTHADLMTQSLLLESMGGNSHAQAQYQSPHMLPQLGHHLGSNGNSVGSSTPNTGMRVSLQQPLQQGYSASGLQSQPLAQNLSNEELTRLLQLMHLQKDQRQSFARADGTALE